MKDVAVHEDARCETDDVGTGTRIWAFAHVMPGAVVGKDCNICDAVFIEGGARIGDRVTVKNAALIWDGVTIADDVFIGPRVTFTNDRRPRAGGSRPREEWLAYTEVGIGATLGASVTVVAGTAVGAFAFAAAGAVVTRDVPDHALVAGNPARIIGWVSRSGDRLDDALVAPDGERYEWRVPGDPSRGLQLRVPAEDVVPSGAD